MLVAAAAAAVAMVVAAVFAIQLGRQHAERRRHHALAWTLSLALFALASATVVIGVLAGWSGPVFALYWLAGALMTVPLLAAGQVMLIDPPRAVLYWTVAGLMGVWAVAALALGLGDMNRDALVAATRAGAIPVGEEVLGADALAYRLLGLYNYTAIIVVIGTVWSAVRARRFGILLIALGVVIAGASFAFVRAGVPAGFSLALAVGVSVMYAGFRSAAKPPRPSSPAGRSESVDASPRRG